MKFLANAEGQLVHAEEESGFLMEQYNKFSDWVIGEQVDFFLEPIANGFAKAGVLLWHWLIANMPEIIGYSAIGAGIFIVLGAMTGKGIVKPFAYWFAAFILGALLLGSV